MRRRVASTFWRAVTRNAARLHSTSSSPSTSSALLINAHGPGTDYADRALVGTPFPVTVELFGLPGGDCGDGLTAESRRGVTDRTTLSPVETIFKPVDGEHPGLIRRS
jgi:hypothetical protein